MTLSVKRSLIRTKLFHAAGFENLNAYGKCTFYVRLGYTKWISASVNVPGSGDELIEVFNDFPGSLKEKYKANNCENLDWQWQHRKDYLVAIGYRILLLGKPKVWKFRTWKFMKNSKRNEKLKVIKTYDCCDPCILFELLLIVFELIQNYFHFDFWQLSHITQVRITGLTRKLLSQSYWM